MYKFHLNMSACIVTACLFSQRRKYATLSLTFLFNFKEMSFNFIVELSSSSIVSQITFYILFIYIWISFQVSKNAYRSLPVTSTWYHYSILMVADEKYLIVYQVEMRCVCFTETPLLDWMIPRTEAVMESKPLEHNCFKLGTVWYRPLLILWCWLHDCIINWETMKIIKLISLSLSLSYTVWFKSKQPILKKTRIRL